MAGVAGVRAVGRARRGTFAPTATMGFSAPWRAVTGCGRRARRARAVTGGQGDVRPLRDNWLWRAIKGFSRLWPAPAARRACGAGGRRLP